MAAAAAVAATAATAVAVIRLRSSVPAAAAEAAAVTSTSGARAAYEAWLCAGAHHIIGEIVESIRNSGSEPTRESSG